MINWNTYLQSVRSAYISGGRSPFPSKRPFYPLKLQVQAVECKPEPTREGSEIGEKLNALEGLQRFSCEQVLLVGPTGSGKSTVLVQLLLAQIASIIDASQTSLPIPILLQLRHYRASLLDLIDRGFQEHQLRLEDGEIRQLLFEGRLLLLLDGAEELPSESARHDLQAFRLAYPHLPLIVSANDLEIASDLELTKVLFLQPLTEGQKQELIDGYADLTVRALPGSSLQSLQSRGRSWQQFGRSPLQLQILCAVWERSREIPTTLGLLLSQLLESDRSKKPSPLQSRLLGHLAYTLIESQQGTAVRYVLPRAEAEEILATFLQKEGSDFPRDRACEQLQALLDSGWLQGDTTFEFSHSLFLNYFAAQRLLALLSEPNGAIADEQLQRNYLNYLKWTEPIALLLGLTDDPTLSLRIVKLAIAVDVRLGARLAGEVKPEFQAQTVRWIAALDLPQLLKLQLLGMTRADVAVKPLMQVLASEETQICGEAIAALSKIASPDAIAGLIQTLDSPDLGIRRQAAEALGDIGSEQAIAALIAILKQEKSSLRGTAAESLGKIGSEQAIEGLIHALSDSKDFVRKIAAKSLGEIGSNKAIEGLTRALMSQDAGIRWVATNALGKIASDRAVEGLIQALADEDFNVREIAAESLGKIASDRAVEGLIQALNHPDSSIAWMAVKALGKTQADRAVEGLIQALNHPNASIAWMAVKALEEIGSDPTVEGLAIALENPDAAVRKSAVEALGEIGSEPATQALLQALENPDSAVCRIATQALGKTRSQPAIEGLLQALEHPDPIVRQLAAEALGAKASSELLPELARRLKTAGDPDLLVRIVHRIQRRYQFYNHNFYT